MKEGTKLNKVMWLFVLEGCEFNPLKPSSYFTCKDPIL